MVLKVFHITSYLYVEAKIHFFFKLFTYATHFVINLKYHRVRFEGFAGTITQRQEKADKIYFLKNISIDSRPFVPTGTGANKIYFLKNIFPSRTHAIRSVNNFGKFSSPINKVTSIRGTRGRGTKARTGAKTISKGKQCLCLYRGYVLRFFQDSGPPSKGSRYVYIWKLDGKWFHGGGGSKLKALVEK